MEDALHASSERRRYFEWIKKDLSPAERGFLFEESQPFQPPFRGDSKVRFYIYRPNLLPLLKQTPIPNVRPHHLHGTDAGSDS